MMEKSASGSTDGTTKTDDERSLTRESKDGGGPGVRDSTVSGGGTGLGLGERVSEKV